VIDEINEAREIMKLLRFYFNFDIIDEISSLHNQGFKYCEIDEMLELEENESQRMMQAFKEIVENVIIAVCMDRANMLAGFESPSLVLRVITKQFKK